MRKVENILIFATILAPIVLAIVESIKKAINIKNNFVPILAIVVGVFIGYIGQSFSVLPTDARLWAGALSGLSAVGLFELIQNRKGTTKEEK